MAKIMKLFCGFFQVPDGIEIAEKSLRQEDYCGDIYPARLISRILN